MDINTYAFIVPFWSLFFFGLASAFNLWVDIVGHVQFPALVKYWELKDKYSYYKKFAGVLMRVAKEEVDLLSQEFEELTTPEPKPRPQIILSNFPDLEEEDPSISEYEPGSYAAFVHILRQPEDVPLLHREHWKNLNATVQVL